MRREATKWEKMFAIHVTDKGLVYRMGKVPQKLTRKCKPPNRKVGKRNEQVYHKRGNIMVNQHMKIYLIYIENTILYPLGW